MKPQAKSPLARGTTRRRLVHILTGLSLFAIFLIQLVWQRSYDGDFLFWYGHPRLLTIESYNGLIRIGWGTITSDKHAFKEGWSGSFWPVGGGGYSANLDYGTTLGFRYRRSQHQSNELGGASRLVTFPYWALTLAFSILPLHTFWRWRRRVRRRVGFDVTPQAETEEK